MRMAKRKFTLTTTEVAELKAAYHQSKDANYSKKLLAVRLYGAGHSTQSILDLIGCGRTSLMEWVQRYQLNGLGGLKDQRQGGNHYKLSQEEKAAIQRDILNVVPGNETDLFGCWNCRKAFSEA
jgi:hypothetical protein